jgi:hypothetical protein
MSWREAFLTRFGVAGFAGITLGRWLRVLRETEFSIDPPYWGRAAVITATSMLNSVVASWENLLYARRIKEAKVEPPLVILGIWRSGTTHLHNLFARDDRFAFPNTYQVFYPNTFLTTEKRNAKFVDFFFPQKTPARQHAVWHERAARRRVRLLLPHEPYFLICLGVSPPGQAL